MPKSMTEKRITNLFSQWQHRLGLDSWSIAVKFVDTVTVDGRPCHMKVNRSDHYDRAVVEVGVGCLDYTALPSCIERDLLELGKWDPSEYVEVSVVHELLHMCLRDIVRASDFIRTDIHPTTRDSWDNAFEQAEEQTVERMAFALVRAWRANA